jgi:hypothetical protein
MTDIETRLREAFRAEAARVQPHLLREFRFPPGRRLRARWRRGPGPLHGSRMLPWLAPLAAALAVAAVISGVRLTVDSRPDAAPRATPNASPAAPPVPVPPFYVSANLHSQDRAWVNNSATGQVISKVGVPGQLPIAIAAAADDRTFVIVFQDLYRSSFTTFARLALRSDGHPASFRKLPLKLPASTGFASQSSIALSPDGQTLALSLFIQASAAAIRANPRAALVVKTEIELISLRTGATRTWTAPPGDFVTDLSWARGSQTLGFLASTQSGLPNDSASQVRLLNVSRPAGGLISASTPVRLRPAGGHVQSMQVTDNGAEVVAWTRMPSRPPSTGRGNLVLAEFSTRTGRQLQVFSRLLTVHGVVGYGQVFSADPSGQHILFSSQGVLSVKRTSSPPQSSVQAQTNLLIARLDNGRVTRLPTPGQDPSEFGAW